MIIHLMGAQWPTMSWLNTFYSDTHAVHPNVHLDTQPDAQLDAPPKHPLSSLDCSLLIMNPFCTLRYAFCLHSDIPTHIPILSEYSHHLLTWPLPNRVTFIVPLQRPPLWNPFWLTHTSHAPFLLAQHDNMHPFVFQSAYLYLLFTELFTLPMYYILFHFVPIGR